MKTIIYLFLSLSFILAISVNSVLYAQEPSEQKTTSSEADSLVDKRPSIKDLPRVRFLALEKRGTTKRIRYFAGDEIHIKLQNDPLLYKPMIERVNDSTLTISGTLLPIKDIRMIKVFRERPFLQLLSRFALYGSLGYLFLDGVNNGFRYNRSSFVVSGSFLVPGLALTLLLKPRLLKLNEHRYLKTILAY